MMETPTYHCNLCGCQLTQQIDPTTKQLALMEAAAGLVTAPRWALPASDNYHFKTVSDPRLARIHICGHCRRAFENMVFQETLEAHREQQRAILETELQEPVT